MYTTRRQFVKVSASAVSAVFLKKPPIAAQPSPSQADPVTLTRQAPSRDTTLKFSPDGTVRPFAGNTVICHLPAQCAMRDIMAEFNKELQASSYRRRLGLTTIASYHMTIFPGPNDQDRRATGWPPYVPLKASIDECDEAVEERMRANVIHCELPLRVVIDVPQTLAYPRACTFRMKGANAEEELKLRSVRNQLSKVYGIHLPDHASYAFHITMAYQMAAFNEHQAASFESMRAAYVHRIVAAQPVLEFGSLEYCTFKDMLRFEPKVLLDCRG